MITRLGSVPFLPVPLLLLRRINLADRVDTPDDSDDADPQSHDMTADKGQSITLNDFIKTSGLVGTGGQAKVLIQSGEVMVNGVWETRRRRKLFPGDAIELLGTKVIVVADGDSQ